MKRRNFITTAAAASAALAFMPLAACRKRDVKTGLALYTVREDMGFDPLLTLDEVARIGFNWLEPADYSRGLFYGMKPADFSREVTSRGMELISSHNSVNYDNIETVAADVAAAGMKYLVLPSLPRTWSESSDGFREAAEFMNRAGEVCNSNGIRFAFHNHTVEFTPIDGVVPFDILLENTDPSLVCFQLDLAWITKAGQDPVDYFRKGAGRFEMWHIKDLSTELNDAILGEGTIDFKPIFREAELSGMKYFHIEQDRCTTHPPLESVAISRQYLVDLLG